MKRRAIDEDDEFNPYDDGRELEDDDEDLDEEDLDELEDEELCEHGNHSLRCEWCHEEDLAAELAEDIAGEFGELADEDDG